MISFDEPVYGSIRDMVAADVVGQPVHARFEEFTGTWPVPKPGDVGELDVGGFVFDVRVERVESDEKRVEWWGVITGIKP